MYGIQPTDENIGANDSLNRTIKNIWLKVGFYFSLFSFVRSFSTISLSVSAYHIKATAQREARIRYDE